MFGPHAANLAQVAVNGCSFKASPGSTNAGIGDDTIMKSYRGWLPQLAADHAKRIAHGNAERLLAERVE